jgi:agmatinase
MTKQEKINAFNPSAVGVKNGNLFGLPFNYEDCPIVILPVPWDVTVSYGDGTHSGPQAILEASPQLDFYDDDDVNAWKKGFHLLPVSKEIMEINHQLRELSSSYIAFLEEGGNVKENPKMQDILSQVNKGCFQLKERVKERSLQLLNDNKIACLLGGDHSTPLGLYEAIAEKKGDFGILQIDAHADLRNAYEGFEFSHASVFNNTLKIPAMKKLVQVGIRDFCEEEAIICDNNDQRIKVFFDRDLKECAYNGITWDSVCDDIVSELPHNVHISFDIDGLDPKLCPNTGTPVPGGLELDQVLHLFRKIVKSGKKIISFDLCEVSPGNDEWDANVGARLLWKLCTLTAISNKL